MLRSLAGAQGAFTSRGAKPKGLNLMLLGLTTQQTTNKQQQHSTSHHITSHVIASHPHIIYHIISVHLISPRRACHTFSLFASHMALPIYDMMTSSVNPSNDTRYIYPLDLSVFMVYMRFIRRADVIHTSHTRTSSCLSARGVYGLSVLAVSYHTSRKHTCCRAFCVCVWRKHTTQHTSHHTSRRVRETLC